MLYVQDESGMWLVFHDEGTSLHSLMYSPAIAGPHHTPPHASQAGKAPHKASIVEHGSCSNTKRNKHLAEQPPHCSIARKGAISFEQCHICRRREHNLHFISAAPGEGGQNATEPGESAAMEQPQKLQCLIAQLKFSISTSEVSAYLTGGGHYY